MQLQGYIVSNFRHYWTIQEGAIFLAAKSEMFKLFEKLEV